MNDTEKIAAHFVGSEETKCRRAALLAELGDAFTDGGPQAVTGEMSRRVKILTDAFDDQLAELKKLL